VLGLFTIKEFNKSSKTWGEPEKFIKLLISESPLTPHSWLDDVE